MMAPNLGCSVVVAYNRETEAIFDDQSRIAQKALPVHGRAGSMLLEVR